MGNTSLNYGITPFWFWNGRMEDDEIVRQIREMRDKGTAGFFIHPRQGLAVPYLSEEWFDKVGVAIEEAKKCGLDVWLYDEYPYPSGIAGGEVIVEHPEYEAKLLEPFQRDADGGEDVVMDLPWGKILSAAAFPVEAGDVRWDRPLDLRPFIGICRGEKVFQMSGLTQYNRKRFFEGKSFKRLFCRLGKGRWRIFIFVETTLAHMKFYGRFVDPMIPGATASFIEITHEQYRRHFGSEFGKTVKGVFSDEIDLNPHGGKIRWSAALPAQFKSDCGYSFTERLPALLGPMGDDTAKVRYDYWNVMTESFIRNYDRTIQDWCHRSGLLYVAEKPVLRSGQMKYLDIPGCDTGHQKVYSTFNTANPSYRANPKIASSGAHFYGKSRALCECFHSIGWSMTMQDMKWIIDWLAIQGINMVTPHAYYYTTDALTKHDAPPSSFFQQPYWPDMGVLNGYVRRLCQTLCDGSRSVDILVADPVTSMWTAMGEKEELKDRLAQDFSRLQKQLYAGHLDYYVIDPRELAGCRADNGRIRRGGESFRVLILPPMTNLEDEAVEAVRRFADAGVPVLSVGCLPAETIGGLPAGRIFSGLFGADAPGVYARYVGGENAGLPVSRCGSTVFLPDETCLTKTLEEMGLRDFSVVTDGVQNDDVPGLHYRKQEDCYFLANGSGKTQEIVFSCAGGSRTSLCRFRLEDGSRERLDAASADGRLSLPLTLAPFESVMLVTGLAEAELRPAPKKDAAEIRLDPDELWEQEIAGSNALRLGKWELAVDGVDGRALSRPVECGTVIPEPVINQMADSHAPLPLKLSDYFGCPKEIVFPSLLCRYTARFDVKTPAGPVWLVMEPGSIGGEWGVCVNGHPLEKGAFGRRAFYLPDNEAADITDRLLPGRNEIVLTAETSHTDDGLVNPLYLCGNFGVCRDPENKSWELTELPETGSIARAPGLPFFAGCRVLKKTVVLDGRSDVVFRLAGYRDCDSVTLYVNGKRAATRSWEPYAFPVEAGRLRSGGNEVELRIRTTALGLYEGQRFDAAAHATRDWD